MDVPLAVEGLFPAVGMHSMGEEVKVDLQAKWHLEEDENMMMVDSHEDDWGRLHDVRASGTVRGRSASGIKERKGSESARFPPVPFCY